MCSHLTAAEARSGEQLYTHTACCSEPMGSSMPSARSRCNTMPHIKMPIPACARRTDQSRPACVHHVVGYSVCNAALRSYTAAGRFLRLYHFHGKHLLQRASLILPHGPGPPPLQSENRTSRTRGRTPFSPCPLPPLCASSTTRNAPQSAQSALSHNEELTTAA